MFFKYIQIQLVVQNSFVSTEMQICSLGLSFSPQELGGRITAGQLTQYETICGHGVIDLFDNF